MYTLYNYLVTIRKCGKITISGWKLPKSAVSKGPRVFPWARRSLYEEAL